MSQQIQITGGAKVRDLNDVIIGTSGVLSSLAFNVSNGVPKLDVNGKILVSQLPNSVMEYLGTWDASTNTPTLVNGTGNAGDVYLCNVAGTVNFGAGPISFVVSDQVIYSGSIWQKASGTSGTVTSVAASITGNSLGITGSPITTSGTLAFAYAGTNLQYVNGAGNLTTFPTLISSIGLSMPSAFSVSNSPLTANGTIAVSGAGSTAQYIRGDGTLATFPAVGGGGGGLSFYLNGGTSQGTISGNTYYQMSPNAIIDTGVDFSTSVNGVVGYFLTDVSSPNQLKIPAGNWNFELYFSASSNGGSPSFYVEVFKYNSGVFTLIGSSVATPEGITNGTAIDLYVTAVAIPTTTLIVSDRIALRITVSTSGRTITLHTQGTHLCEVLTTFPSGISALNGLTIGTQYLVTGTSGSDFNIASVLDTHTFNIPDAGASARGVMTTGTQTIAGAKTFSGNLTANSFIKIGGGNLEFLKADGSVDSTAYVQSVTATSPLVRTGATNTPILSIPAATSSVNGYLTSTDWTTFNNKTSASGTASQIAYFTGANSLASDSFLWWDASLNRIGIGDFSTVVPPAALSMISTIGAWYNRNVASTVNYSEIGLYYDGGTYGHLIQSNKVGTTDYSRISFINNGQTALVLAEDYNVGINTRTPVPNISGPGGQGLDIYSATTVSLALHNATTGSTISDGSRLYVTTGKNLLLRNLETASVSIIADDGDVYINAGGFDRITALSTGNVGIMNPATIPEALTVSGSIQQSGITSTMVKVNSSGKFIAAVAGTDYENPLTFSSPLVRTTNTISIPAATTSVNGYLTSTDWNTFNNKGSGTVTSVTGTAPVVSSGGSTPAISMAAATTSVNGYLTSTNFTTFNNKFTLPSLTSGSVLFSDGSTIAQSNSNFFWDNTSKALGVGTQPTAGYVLHAYAVSNANAWAIIENPKATGATALFLKSDSFFVAGFQYDEATNITQVFANYGDLKLTSGGNKGITIANSTGNVGIGTSSPDIFGRGYTGTIFGVSAAAGDTGIEINGGSGNGAYIDLGTGGTRRMGIISTATDSQIISLSTLPLVFKTNSVTAMTINSSQNVGIGTTSPSSYYSTKLVVYADSDNGISIAGTSTGERFLMWAKGTTGTDTYTGYIGYNVASDFMRFGTAATERMRITSGGNVLIGSTNDGYTNRLFVVGSGYTGSTNVVQFRNSDLGILFSLRDDGLTNVGLGANSPYNYSTSGHSAVINSSGVLGYLVSTRESKGNIKSISNVDFINQLNPVQFNYRKKDDTTNTFTDELYDNITYGFIADEAEKVNKDLVFYKNDGATLAGFDYNNMIAILTKAVQEQNKIITSLQDRLDKLENK